MAMGMAALLLAACTSKDPNKPPKDYSNPAAPAQPAPAKFALADFQSLRYLEGSWKGTMANGSAFYEAYHFLNDSTLLGAGVTDSTFQAKKDSSVIAFRDGAVTYTGSAVYTAEKLDSTVVDFRASETYHFTWTREGDDAWKATLYSTQDDGTERVTSYEMRRVKR
jgi:hypothetical protein